MPPTFEEQGEFVEIHGPNKYVVETNSGDTKIRHWSQLKVRSRNVDSMISTDDKNTMESESTNRNEYNANISG